MLRLQMLQITRPDPRNKTRSSMWTSPGCLVLKTIRAKPWQAAVLINSKMLHLRKLLQQLRLQMHHHLQLHHHLLLQQLRLQLHHYLLLQQLLL